MYTINQIDAGGEGSAILKKFFDICQSRLRGQQVMYVHNLDFDGFFLIHYIINANMAYDWLYMKSKLYYIKVYFSKATLEFRCSYKILPYSLNALGENYLKKKKNIFPYKVLHSNTALTATPINLASNDFNNDEEYTLFKQTQDLENFNIIENLTLYCQHDATLLFELVNAYWKVLRDLKITDTDFIYSASSIALQFYIKNYNYIDLKPKITFERFAREAYYGGRCEVFGNLREGEVGLYYDYPGMYALCLQENLPAGGYYFCKPTKIELPGFYKITFQSNMEYPVLPVKTDKLYFPNGTYTGTYWFEEILLFLEHGGQVKKIHSAVVTERFEPAAKEFSSKLTSLKQRGGWFSLGAKLIINSFYGRLGTSGTGVVARITTDSSLAQAAKNFVQFGDYYIFEKEHRIATKKNVLVAAAITAKARIQLYKTLQYVIRLGGRPLYCDTDSLLWAIKEKSNLDWEGSFQIGLNTMTLSREAVTNFLIKTALVAPKTYGLLWVNGSEIVRIKGISNHALKFNNFFRAWVGGGVLHFANQTNYSTSAYEGCWLQTNKKICLTPTTKRILNKDKTASTPLDQVDSTRI